MAASRPTASGADRKWKWYIYVSRPQIVKNRPPNWSDENVLLNTARRTVCHTVTRWIRKDVAMADHQGPITGPQTVKHGGIETNTRIRWESRCAPMSRKSSVQPLSTTMLDRHIRNWKISAMKTGVTEKKIWNTPTECPLQPVWIGLNYNFFHLFWIFFWCTLLTPALIRV